MDARSITEADVSRNVTRGNPVPGQRGAGPQLDGGPVNKYYGATGAVHCTGVYNGQYTFYASGCP